MNVDPIETNIRKLRNIEKTKNSFLVAEDLFTDHLSQAIILSAILHSHYQKSQKWFL